METMNFNILFFISNAIIRNKCFKFKQYKKPMFLEEIQGADCNNKKTAQMCQ